MAGAPAEYFNANQRVPLARRWGCDRSVDAYAAALRARRTDANGVFGVKLQADQLAELGHDPRELLPGAVFVRIRRADATAQAVSLWTALKTGAWSERATAPEPPERPAPVRYSYRGIRRCLRLIEAGERTWDAFFAAAGEPVVTLGYEALAADPAEVVRDTLRALLGAVELPAPGAPSSRRQAGERSAALAARFAREHARR